MRNQKWNQFDYRDEEIPETWFEACVFLSRAEKHLYNRIDGPLNETHQILNKAHADSARQRKSVQHE